MKFRDFSPLLPLSWKSLIYLDVYGAEYEEQQRCRRLLYEDMAFFLHRLSLSFTGDGGMEFLPSNVESLRIRYESIHAGEQNPS